MNIGMILDKNFPPDPRVENEAIQLIKAGHSVYLFCLTYKDELENENINQIKVRRYKSNKLEYKLSALAYSLFFYRVLMQPKINHFIKNNKIDALHIHDIRIAKTVFEINKKLKLPLVLDLHDNMPEVMKFYPHLQKFPGKYIISPKRWKKFEESFIKNADKIITVSQEFIDEVVERTNINKDKILLVPNTIREEFYENKYIDSKIVNTYKDNFVLLYLGDTHLRRGLQTAIASISQLKTKILNIKLVIVGHNTTDSILKKQVKDLQIEEFVDFKGWQDVQYFPSYIEVSNICLSPLHRNIQHDVAYANKLFQYMSLGKPLLVSNATAQKKLVEKFNSGLVHKEKDVKDFTRKVLQLFYDKELQKSLGDNGKKFVRNHFTWNKTSKKLINLYDNLKS